ncbi:alpha/beta fold hydrolase [Nocardioides bruguierae]|uniref:alpha/beta fold hydrolase n=1 Tax=Nocardioides bruguierae TaxID=2945102 RepID=UPI0020216548|nr:alpha/beta hydrolase [Nocardioides bruguierae]MCL8023891.1 alpha/beta hydrolase [Nocardioides bruguierae]
MSVPEVWSEELRSAARPEPSGGVPWLLLHAFPLSSAIFDRLAPALLGRGERVLVADLPGLGRSPRPGTEPSMEAVGDALAAVLDAHDLPRARVLGISTGGYAALELARTRPDRVESLVLASTTPWRIEPDRPALRRETAATLEREHSTGSLADVPEAALGPTAHREQPALVSLVRDLVKRADPDGVAWMARAIAARHDTATVVTAFPREVHLLFGDEDTDTPPERATQIAALRPAHAPTRVTVLPGTGHLTVLERPREVVESLLG